MRLDPETEIKSVVFIDVNTNEESLLFEHTGSYCHFRHTTKYENYFVQLRLDWHDKDEHGEPTLDADIWTFVSGRKISVEKGSWHQTRKTIDEGSSQWLYIFKFKNLKLHIITKKTIAKSLTAKARITESLAINTKK